MPKEKEPNIYNISIEEARVFEQTVEYREN